MSGAGVAKETFLVADIGGTNARFALVVEGALQAVQNLQVAAHLTFQSAIDAYLAQAGAKTVRAAALAIAGPTKEERVAVTNSSWWFLRAELTRHYGWQRLLVLNDFEALALSLPALSGGALIELKPGRSDPLGPKALIGPGTGLGVGSLVQGRRGGWLALPGEGGHVSLIVESEEEAALLAFLRPRFGRVSAERALSGEGLSHLYEFLSSRVGSSLHLAPEEITRRALAGSDALAGQAVALFLGLLGCMAGDLALTLGATGGVYLAGGILPRLVPLLGSSPLIARFLNKGRMRAYLEPIPVYLVTEPAAALIGGAQALQRAP